MKKSKEPACKTNPRLCKEAPNNRLADAIRTPILKWPGPSGLKVRLNNSVVCLCAAVKQCPKGDPVRERAIREYASCLKEVEGILAGLEHALAEYVGEGAEKGEAE